MPIFRLSRCAQGERKPLLERRQPHGKRRMRITVLKPTDQENIDYLRSLSFDPSPTPRLVRPKLKLQIPFSDGADAVLVGTVQRNPHPTLEDGVVASGTFTDEFPQTREEARAEYIESLQWSGDWGWNDYLHWYTHHPLCHPSEPYEPCSCVRMERERQEDRMFGIVQCNCAWVQRDRREDQMVDFYPREPEQTRGQGEVRGEELRKRIDEIRERALRKARAKDDEEMAMMEAERDEAEERLGDVVRRWAGVDESIAVRVLCLVIFLNGWCLFREILVHALA